MVGVFEIQVRLCKRGQFVSGVENFTVRLSADIKIIFSRVYVLMSTLEKVLDKIEF